MERPRRGGSDRGEPGFGPFIGGGRVQVADLKPHPVLSIGPEPEGHTAALLQIARGPIDERAPHGRPRRRVEMKRENRGRAATSAADRIENRLIHGGPRVVLGREPGGLLESIDLRFALNVRSHRRTRGLQPVRLRFGGEHRDRVREDPGRLFAPDVGFRPIDAWLRHRKVESALAARHFLPGLDQAVAPSPPAAPPRLEASCRPRTERGRPGRTTRPPRFEPRTRSPSGPPKTVWRRHSRPRTTRV